MGKKIERTLILGLGNEILQDDAVGLQAARRVACRARGRAELAEACVATVDLLPIITGYDRLIVIDAFISESDPPGTEVRATPWERRPGFGYRSLHTLPFDEMLALGHLIGISMPRRVSIHGLCVEDPTTFGVGFSPTVARAWQGWADRILQAEFGAPDDAARVA